MVTVARIGNALVADAGHRIVAHLIGEAARRQLADGGDGAALAVIHPGLDEGLDRGRAILGGQLLQAPLAGAAGADLGAIIAIPDVVDADLLHSHADDVRLVLEILLAAHAGEMHALFVDGLGIGQIGGGLRRADIGVVGARQRPEERLALEEDRHAERQIGVMGPAIEGAVVEIGVALLDVLEELDDRPGGQLQRRDVDRQRFLDADQAAVIGEDPAGHVAGVLDDAGAAGLHDRIGHLADDRFDPARDDRQQDGVEGLDRGSRGRRRDGMGCCRMRGSGLSAIHRFPDLPNPRKPARNSFLIAAGNCDHATCDAMVHANHCQHA